MTPRGHPPTVLFDANVFFGAALRSLVVQTAGCRLHRARWTAAIHDEWIAAVQKARPGIDRTKLDRTRALMDRAVPDSMVTGYEHLVPTLDLPDPDDRHVLAAAIACRAEYIVSFNERDFPPASLSRYGVEVCHPDCFLLGLSERDGDAFLKAIRDDMAHYRHPCLDIDAYSEALRRAGVPKTADHLRGMRALLQA